MKDQATPMPLDAQLLALRVTFFLERTRPRLLGLQKLIKALSLPPREGAHWLNASFLGPEPSDLVFSLHIDDHATPRGAASRKPAANVALWVEISIRPRPGPGLPAAMADRPRADWMVQELSKASKKKLELGFFDVDVSIPTGAQEPPTHVVAIPLTIGGRTLPATGVQYSGDPDAGTVDGFRWARGSRGVTVRLSYSREMNVAELVDIWTNERARIGAYVEEALTR